ncbi:MAG: class I SAM-dependent methyltransferase [Nitrososphaerota archaeon]|nr:class I SAM-dependent methyltransferase [Candidatus Bathyarchaeota archaeon]MDW8048931.1 class I SAM-dependent methyltransferase [Nitrososphaerota archaeon]
MRKIYFDRYVFYVFDGVYEPAEDTFLIAESLEDFEAKDVLEIGTGCGILSIISAEKAEKVVATDVNPVALRCAKFNAKVNGVHEKIDFIQGDLFGPLRRGTSFDMILFNPPYLPTEEAPSDWIDYAWSGGQNGRSVIDRFLGQVSQHLKPGGRILLAQSSLSNIELTMRKLELQGFETNILKEKRVPFESIILVYGRRTLAST